MSTTLPPFAITWGSGAPQNIVEPSDALKLTGWTGAPAPEYQYFNWWMNYSDAWLTYLRTRGLPDFHADTQQTSGYRFGDRVQWTDGKTYVALQTFSGAAHTPADGAYFSRWGHTDTELVHAVTEYPDPRVGDGAITSGLAASIGTVSNAFAMTAKGVRTVTCKVSGVPAVYGEPTGAVTLALSGSLAFSSGIGTVQVTVANGVGTVGAVVVGTGAYKNEATITLADVNSSTSDIFVTLMGM